MTKIPVWIFGKKTSHIYDEFMECQIAANNHVVLQADEPLNHKAGKQ